MYSSLAFSETTAISPIPTPWDIVTGKSRHEHQLHRHDALFCQGDDAEYLFGVVDGVMCNYQFLTDGRRQVISFAYPGDVIGFGHLDTYRFSCSATCDARVRRILSKALFRHAEGRADIGRRLLDIATAELASTQEHQVLLGRKSALEKLASFLLTLVRRSGGEFAQLQQFQIPMTRMDIADYLGLTVETVCRTLTKLKVMGVIDVPQTTTVVVRQMHMLKELAEREKRDDRAF
jgi:CRP-like cAMP-binding protein